MSKSETYTGEVIKISPRFWNGWGFATLQIGREETIDISGTLEGTTVGMRLVVTGVWEEHAKYGKRLKLATVLADLPSTHRGIEMWLLSRLPQIGPIRAEDLVDRFGAGLWDVLDADCQALTAVSGITPERAKEIQRAYQEFKTEREALVEFFSLGLSLQEAKRTLRKLGADGHAHVKNDPYVLYLDVGGFSFGRTDHLAIEMGGDRLAGSRLVSAVVEAGRRLGANHGDTLHTIDEVVSGAERIIKDEIGSRAFRYAVAQAVRDERYVRFDTEEGEEGIMLASQARAEEDIAAKLLILRERL